MLELNGLDRLPADLREPARRYATRVWEHAGKKVACLAFYGSVLGADFDPATQTASNVAVFEQVDLNVLRQLAAEGHRFGRDGISAPLALNRSFIRASLDSYPLELIEIQQQYVVLHGDDLFADLEFDPAHVRLQCERELKVLGLAMRQAAVADGANSAHIRKAGTPSLAAMLRTLRGLLWLRGRQQALPIGAMVAEVERIVGHPLPGVQAMVSLRGAADWPAFVRLYQDVEALGQVADGW